MSAPAAIPFDPTSVAAAAKERRDDGTEAELERVAMLDAVTYDRERDSVAARLGLRVGTLDAEREKRHPREAKPHGQGSALNLSEPEPWPVAVNGAALLDAITRELTRYVVLPAGSAEAIALWVIHTHALDAFGISPRLAILSPEKGCGKSTALDVLGKLVPRPLATANTSPAAVFRVVETARPTLLIDEGDALFGGADRGEELRGILNAGHRRGGNVIRCVGDGAEPRVFATFAPCAIAAIGRLPATLEDRAVVVEMRRAAGEERPELFRHDRTPTLDKLARMAARWAADSAHALCVAEPEMPESLHNRAADNWRPLFAVADAAGDNWGQRARAIAVAAVSARADDGSHRTRLLADIRAVFAATGADRLASAELCDLLADPEEAPWGEWKNGKQLTPHGLARLLAPFKVAPRTIRLASGLTPKGYHRDEFAEAFARYLPPPAAPFADVTPRQVATPPQVNVDGLVAHVETATAPDVVALVECEKRNEVGPCGGVAVVAAVLGAALAEGTEEGEL